MSIRYSHLPDSAVRRFVSQMFSYPFSRSWNETEDGEHYPDISDLKYLCDLAGM